MGYDVRAVDTSRNRDRWYEPLLRTWSYVRAAGFIVTARRRPVVYLAFPDGSEVPVATLLLLACALRGNAAIVHHHSRRYLARRSFWVSLGIRAERRCRFVHLLQCECLAGRYREIYGVEVAMPLSNAFAVTRPDTILDRAHASSITLGYFGTISAGKGFLSFLEIVEPMLVADPCLRVSVGGKCASNADRMRVADVSARFPGRVVNVGELYGEEKRAFLASLDLLVFPTQYRSETEGIVLLEALSVGTPFAATDLGCIPEIATLGGGVSVPLDELASAVHHLRSDGNLGQRRAAALASFKTLATRSRAERDAALAAVLASPHAVRG